MTAEAASGESIDENYSKWEKYATDEAQAMEAEEKAAKPAQEYPFKSSGVGYEFRPGHKTKFPEISLAEEETEEAAALRTAGECRERGNISFADGTVWAAQQAVDNWGQGLLALERCRNLRKYRKARIAGGTATEADFACEAAEEADVADDAATAAEAAAAVATGAQVAEGDVAEPPRRLRRIPEVLEVSALQLTLRLNIAQALLKLREFEKCVVYCDLALDMDPCNMKALWRKAKSVWGIRNPGLAREALDRILELDPANAAALALLREISGEEARKRARRLGARPAQAAAAARREAAAAAASQAANGGGIDDAEYWARAAKIAADDEDESEEDDADEAPLTLREAAREGTKELLEAMRCCRRR